MNNIKSGANTSVGMAGGECGKMPESFPPQQ